jgi:hypothetical protein
VTPWHNSKPPRIPTVDEPASGPAKTAVVFDDAALPHHEFSKLFPMIEGEQFDGLVKDIRENGQREPIILHQGAILDGRNRFAACVDAGVEPSFEEFTGTDPLAFVISRNLHRRHLDESQRAMVAAGLANLSRGGDRSKAPIGGLSDAQAAKALNVGERSVERAKVVRREGVPELVKAVEAGTLPVSAAAAIAKQPAEEQRAAIAAPKPQKAKAAPKPKAAEPWNGAALIGPFQLLVAQVRGRETEAARFLCDQHEDDIAALIALAEELINALIGPAEGLAANRRDRATVLLAHR